MSILIPTKEEILNDLLQNLCEGCNIDQITKILFKKLKNVIPLDRIGVTLISEDGRYFVSRVNIADFQLQLVRGFKSEVSKSTLQEVLENRKSRIIENLEFYLKKKPQSISTRLMVKEGIRSNISVPLIAENKPIGILFLASQDLGAYGKAHIDIVDHIAPAISITLEKAILVENLNDNQKFLVETIAAKEGLEDRLENESLDYSDGQRTWKEWEKYVLVKTLRRCRGKIYGNNGAAKVLDLPPTTLQGKLKKLGLNRKEILSIELA